eukprot:792950_1
MVRRIEFESKPNIFEHNVKSEFIGVHSIPLEQLEAVDRDHFTEELIKLLKDYRFILNQEAYLGSLELEQALIEHRLMLEQRLVLAKMNQLDIKMIICFCVGVISVIFGFPPGFLGSFAGYCYFWWRVLSVK